MLKELKLESPILRPVLPTSL